MNYGTEIDGYSICAIIVTYRYAYDSLQQLISSISTQVNHICLIDNNDSKVEADGVLKLRNDDCTVICNRTNLGLAKALNQGIRFASENRFGYVLLLDQDSRPAPDMAETLITAVRDPSLKGKKIAAVGPVVIDQHQKKPLPFLQFKPVRIRKISPSLDGRKMIPVDFLISSGSLIEVEALKTVGFMDENLFIDNIDLEWCFRAKKAGYQLYGIRDASLYHRLGDNALRLPFFKRYVLFHYPERQYFIMRNRLLLYKRNYVPFRWKINDFPRLLFKFVFFSLFVSPRRKNAAMMVRGFKDGIFRQREKTGEGHKTRN